MSERLVAGIIVGLSILLLVSEAALISLYGLRFELVLLPVVVFLALLGLLFGVSLLRPARPAIESVSARRARAMKDEKVRKLLDGYEVDEEFLPGRKKRKKKQEKQHSIPPQQPEATPGRSAAPQNRKDPFEDLDPKLLKIAESFGGFEKMVQKIDAMDAVAFKRLLYSMGMQGCGKNDLLQPVREALAKAAGGKAGLRQLLDHREMIEYMEQTLTGKNMPGEESDPHRSLDLGADDIAGMVPPAPNEFSHKPDDVINRFKHALNKK